MTITRFVIVGFGNIGQRHAQILQQMEQAELSAIVDLDPGKENTVTEQYSVPFFRYLNHFIEASVDADVLVIATPNGYHYEQAYQALDNGFHVLVEKPIALTAEACKGLITMANQKDKQLHCVLQNRYSPPARWLKQVVDDKRLGEIFMVDVNCFWNRDGRYYSKNDWRGDRQLDGGTLFTQFSHFIDLMIWVFGDVRDAEGRFFNFNHSDTIDFEDSGILNLSMESGAKIDFTYSTSVWDRNMESSISVIGEKGSLKIGGQYMDSIEHCHIEGYEQPTIPSVNPPNDYGHFKGSAANHLYVLDNVIKALNHQPYELAYPQEACKSIALIEKVYQDR